MKLVTVEDLREGDIIASDVLLEDYTVVLSKGTVIKTQYIDKLRELEVFTVYIEERQEKEEIKTQSKPPVAAKKTEDTPCNINIIFHSKNAYTTESSTEKRKETFYGESDNPA